MGLSNQVIIVCYLNKVGCKCRTFILGDKFDLTRLSKWFLTMRPRVGEPEHEMPP